MSTKQNKTPNDERKSENKIESSIVRTVGDLGGTTIKLEVPSIRGWPDRLVFLDGLILFVEVKKPGGVVSPHQDRIIADLLRRGYNATVVWSLEEFKEYVEKVKSQA